MTTDLSRQRGAPTPPPDLSDDAEDVSVQVSPRVTQDEAPMSSADPFENAENASIQVAPEPTQEVALANALVPNSPIGPPVLQGEWTPVPRDNAKTPHNASHQRSKTTFQVVEIPPLRPQLKPKFEVAEISPWRGQSTSSRVPSDGSSPSTSADPALGHFERYQSAKGMPDIYNEVRTKGNKTNNITSSFPA